MKKKRSTSLLAAVVLIGTALLPVAGVSSAASAAEVAPRASTSCSQTITPATVFFNVNGREFGVCYNGTTTSFQSNPVVRIRAGAQQARATFSGVGTVTIPANTSRTFGNLTLTSLVVG